MTLIIERPSIKCPYYLYLSSNIFTELHGLPTAARSLFRWNILQCICSSSEPDPRDSLHQEFKLAVQAANSAQSGVDTTREQIETLKTQVSVRRMAGVVRRLQRALGRFRIIQLWPVTQTVCLTYWQRGRVAISRKVPFWTFDHG
jgi:hypothetical protein